MKKIFVFLVVVFSLVGVLAAGDSFYERESGKSFFGFVGGVNFFFGGITGAFSLVDNVSEPISNIECQVSEVEVCENLTIEICEPENLNQSLEVNLTVNESEECYEVVDLVCEVVEEEVCNEEVKAVDNKSGNKSEISQGGEVENVMQVENINESNGVDQYFYWETNIVNSYFDDSDEMIVELRIPKDMENITKDETNFRISSLGNYGPFEKVRDKLGRKRIEAEIKNVSIIKSIKFDDLVLEDNFSLGVEELHFESILQSYAIDPSRLNFTSATVTLIAKGEELYKCKEWDFSRRECYGDWILFKDDLIPGKEYSFLLTPDDPAFFEVNITNAVHLDENYSFISSIFQDVEYLDGNWSEEINVGEIVRVTYEENLTSGSVIDVYAKSLNGSNSYFEIYEVDSNVLVGVSKNFNSDGEVDYITLENLTYDNNVFDFVVKGGGLSFDYVHDATRYLMDNSLIASSTFIVEGENITVQGGYAISGTGGPAGDITIGLNDTNHGALLDSSCSVGDTFEVTSINQVVCVGCTDNLDGTITLINPDNGETFSLVWNLHSCENASAYSPVNFTTYESTATNAVFTNSTGNITISSPLDVNIAYPLNGSYYNNPNLFIRAEITGQNDSCWYNFNDNTNVSFVCGSEPNITAVEGLNNLTVFANNSFGYIANDTSQFTINSSIPLSVAITSPANNSIKTIAAPKLKLLANDNDFSLVNYSLYVYYENDTLYSTSSGNLTNGTELEIVLDPALLLIGNLTTYKIYFNATDAGGNNATSNILYYTLTLPAVTLLSPVNNYWTNNSDLSFSFKVLDGAYSNVSCSLYLNNVLNQTNGTVFSDNTQTTFNVTGISEAVDQTWKVMCTDPGNNTGEDFRYFNVDLTPPVVNWINYTPEHIHTNMMVNFTANVTDNFEVDYVVIDINGTSYYMNSIGNDIYLYEYNLTLGLGDYNYTVSAYDNAGNNATQMTGNFTVESEDVFVFDLQPIANTTYNETQVIEISVNATSVHAIDTVYANVTNPLGGLQMVVLNNVTTERYNGSYTIPYIKGRYNVTFFANDTLGGYNDTETTYFILEDVSPPEVDVLSPVCESYDENSEVALTLNITDLSSIDYIYANVTSPNGTNYTLSDFSTGISSDNFESDGSQWSYEEQFVASNHTCVGDVNQSVVGKMFIGINGTGVSGETYCGFNGIERVDGDFDMNITFNVTNIEDGAFFLLRSSNLETFQPEGPRAYIMLRNQGGTLYYNYGYYNGTETVQGTSLGESNGKFRVERFNHTCNESYFNLYYWNNSDSSWVVAMENVSVPSSSRAQFVQIYAVSLASGYGEINATVEDFNINSQRYNFTIFNYTSEVGIYNVSFFVNDSLGYINNTETASFNVTQINDPPSRPFISSPGSDEVVSGIYNITWTQVSDPENDSLRFNITLLNVNGSVNSTIVSDYGDSNSNYYSWNTTEFIDGEYKISIVVFENETIDGYSNSDTMTGNFSIDNTAPIVKIIYPLNHTLDTGETVALSFNISDSAEIDTILANVTIPNGSSYLISDFSDGLFIDYFDSDTIGTYWDVPTPILAQGQNCTSDINGTVPGKMFLAINGTGSGTTTTKCGFDSQRINGDYDINITFNLSLMEDDTVFLFRSSNIPEFVSLGTRAFLDVEKRGGVTYYVAGYNNATDTTNETFYPTNDTEGKLRIKRTDSVGIPVFNLYFWNSTSSSWVDVYGNIALPRSAKTQFLQLQAWSIPSTFGQINISIDEFVVLGDNHTFAIFNNTDSLGEYNVTFLVNDTLGNLNDTERTNFNITIINDYPSRALINEPDTGDIVSGLFNITWDPSTDPENDSLQVNITLLNTDDSFNSTIVSNYGDQSTIFYEWNSSNYPDGDYKISVRIFENETLEGYSVVDYTGNFTVYNSPPSVEVVYPLNETFDIGDDVALTLNISDLVGADSIIANVTYPNGSSSLVSDFTDGLFVDYFDSNTSGLYWDEQTFLPNNQSCVLDINGTDSGKMYLAVTGTGFGTETTICGFDSRRVDGNFDVNITFNLSLIEDDTVFLFRSNSEKTLSTSGIRAFLDVEQRSGIRYYVAGYNNGSGSTNETFFPTNDTEGKLRIKRSNMTGTPVFNLYFWNSSNSSWVDTYGNLSVENSSRTQVIQFQVWSTPSNFGLMNVSIDEFVMTGDNYTFAIFNKTSATGTYNVTFDVNNTFGYLNDTESTTFNIADFNDPPSRAYITEPDPNDFVSGIFNITWDPSIDPENDSLRFNITLLNVNGSFNSTIVSDYGDASSTYYMWDTTIYPDGNYSLSLTVYENETPEAYSDIDTLAGNFTIDNTLPYIEINSPANTTYGNSTILVNITSDGNNVWFYNGTDNETYTSPVYITFSEGVNILYAWANDSADNLNSTSVVFTVDLTEPNIWFENTTTTTGPQRQDFVFVNISANDSLTDIESITIYLNNDTGLITSVTNFSSNFYYNFTGLPSNQSYYIKASANDSAGNIKNTTIRWVFLDTDPPEFINLANQTLTYGNSLVYDIDANDSEYVDVDCFSINDTTNFAINCSGYLTNATSLNVGVYSINISVNDTLGNIRYDVFYVNVTLFDSCTYGGSGNWQVDCSDNCIISSNVDVLGNNLSIIGSGSFTTSANISNFSELYIEGDSSTNRCDVYCVDGGCFG